MIFFTDVFKLSIIKLGNIRYIFCKSAEFFQDAWLIWKQTLWTSSYNSFKMSRWWGVSCLALHESMLESVPPLIQRAAQTFPAVIHLLQPALQVSCLLAVRLHKLSAAEVNGQHDGLTLIQSLLQLLRGVNRGKVSIMNKQDNNKKDNPFKEYGISDNLVLFYDITV